MRDLLRAGRVRVIGHTSSGLWHLQSRPTLTAGQREQLTVLSTRTDPQGHVPAVLPIPSGKPPPLEALTATGRVDPPGLVTHSPALGDEWNPSRRSPVLRWTAGVRSRAVGRAVSGFRRVRAADDHVRAETTPSWHSCLRESLVRREPQARDSARPRPPSQAPRSPSPRLTRRSSLRTELGAERRRQAVSRSPRYRWPGDLPSSAHSLHLRLGCHLHTP